MDRKYCTMKSNKCLKAISVIFCTVLISAIFIPKDVFAYHRLPEERLLGVTLGEAAAVVDGILAAYDAWGKDQVRKEMKYDYPDGGVWGHAVTRRTALSTYYHGNKTHSATAVIIDDVDRHAGPGGHWASACVSKFWPKDIGDVHVYYSYW